jgi:hypothetical protein
MRNQQYSRHNPQLITVLQSLLSSRSVQREQLAVTLKSIVNKDYNFAVGYWIADRLWNLSQLPLAFRWLQCPALEKQT